MSDKKQSIVYYLKLLYPYVKKDKGLLLFGLFAMLITSALKLLDPLILAHIIDKSIPANDLNDMFRYGLFFVVVVVFSGLLSYLQIILLSRLGIKIITKFKGEVFKHLLKLPVPWFNEQPVGELIARVESDSERVKVLFSELSIMIIGNLLFFAGVFIVLFIRESKITLMILPAVIIAIITYYFLIRWLGKFYKRIREKYADISAKITDFVQGMPLVQVLNREARVIRELQESSASKKRLETQTSFIEYGSQGVFMFVFNVLFIIAIIKLSAPKIVLGMISLGTLIVFIQYMYRMIWPLMQISENVMQIQRSFVSLRRILELTELPTEDSIFTGT
ncbi:MAG TPA: ABC transporter transmembrane domain-containing protein, partial [Candidatus Cloacimonadota bacterium]|nr:ABC transporter transmembrane domain-containing protein [Candidatus Cloacimonadota bacterium]